MDPISKKLRFRSDWEINLNAKEVKADQDQVQDDIQELKIQICKNGMAFESKLRHNSVRTRLDGPAIFLRA